MVIRGNQDYKNIIDKIVKTGNEVNGTYELIAKGLTTKMMSTQDLIDILGLDVKVLDDFVKAIMTFTHDEIGPYKTEKYFMLIPDLKVAISHLIRDCIESRRCVIQFPPEHCFQSIQFLVRENTINVVCFMRSCDVIKNLPYDLWLCSFLADMFAYYMNEIKVANERPYLEHNISMFFGSLHLYKDDLKNVL